MFLKNLLMSEKNIIYWIIGSTVFAMVAHVDPLFQTGAGKKPERFWVFRMQSLHKVVGASERHGLCFG